MNESGEYKKRVEKKENGFKKRIQKEQKKIEWNKNEKNGMNRE